MEVGGDSGKGSGMCGVLICEVGWFMASSGHSERLGGDSEVAESGETIKRPGSTSSEFGSVLRRGKWLSLATTPAPTEPASSPASLNFDMREGESRRGRGVVMKSTVMEYWV